MKLEQPKYNLPEVPRRRFRSLGWLGLTVALMLTASSGYAQPSFDSQVDEAVVRKARELFQEGVSLNAKGKVEEARVAFAASWRYKQHWATVANLGEAEVRLGRYDEAAEHLTIALRMWQEGKDESLRQKRAKDLEVALAHVATVHVKVDVENEPVSVNGRPVGSSPLRDPVFVRPGKLVVQAGKEPRIREQTIELKAGETAHVELTFAERAVAKPATAKQVPAPTPVPVEPADNDLTKTWVVAGGATLTVLTGIAALWTGHQASVARDEYDELHQEATAAGGPNVCAATVRPSVCASIDDRLSKENNYGHASTGLWVGTGVFAAATVATYLFWPNDTSTRLVPEVSSKQAGLIWQGRF